MANAEAFLQDKTDFLNRLNKVKSEIKTKFQKVRKDLDDKELEILKRVEEIEKEIIENFDKSSTMLSEITQAKEKVFEILKCNETNNFLKKNLEMYDEEIEKINQNLKIDAIIELDWDTELLNLSTGISGVTINVKRPTKMTLSQPHKTIPIKPEQQEAEVPSQYLYHIRPKSFPFSVSELHQSIKQIRDQRIPIALHNTIPGQITLIAETCIKLEPQNKFSHSIVCDLIISNLTAGKPTNDVREGLNKMARFAFSIFTDCVESSTAVFQEGAGFFGTEIDPHLSHAYHILPFFGFDIEESARRFYLSRDKLSIPNTNDTIVFLIADLLMAEQDLKKFGYLSKDEVINFYHQYPTVAQYSDVMPSKKQPQSQPPQSSGDQSQYSSTFTTQNPAAQMQPHSRPQSDMPPPSSMRRTLEAESQYASGASGPGAPVHSMQGYAGQPSVQQHRAVEPDPNNFNVAANFGSGYNVPQRYSQEQQHPSMNMSPHSTGDFPPGMSFQPPSHSQPSNVTTREWSCPHCTALNASINRKCGLCNKSPDFKIEQQSTQNMPEQITQQKQCQRCKQMNRLQEISCANCHASFM